MRAFARGAARAISDGYGTGRQRREALDRLPERLLHLRGLGREELERRLDRRTGSAQRDRFYGHHANSLETLRMSSAITRGSRASQIATVNLPDSPVVGATRRVSTSTSPASVRNPATSSSGKPRRR